MPESLLAAAAAMPSQFSYQVFDPTVKKRFAVEARADTLQGSVPTSAALLNSLPNSWEVKGRMSVQQVMNIVLGIYMYICTC